MSLEELEKNQKLKYWYEQFQLQKESGKPVRTYCYDNDLCVSTFYEYQKKLKQLLCDEVNANHDNGVVPFVAITHKTIVNNEKIIVTKGTIKIEFESNTNYQVVESIIKALLC